MKQKLILGVDIGSSNVKALLFTLQGDIVAGASEEVHELYPSEKQIEQDPMEIWTCFCSAVKTITGTPGVDRENIAGIGLDSNRCGLMLADDNWNPLTNIMTWRDFRSEAYVSSYKKEYPQIDIYRITGEEGLPQHSLFKVLWCRSETPDLWGRCRHIFLSPKDYVLYRLLGRQVSSRSMAQSTGLFDINTLSYSRQILDSAGIEPKMLPALYDSNEVVGRLSAEIAGMLGLPEGLPVVCGLCDATASQLGSGSVKEGLFTISIGTCGAIRTFSPKPIYAENKFSQIRVFSPFGYVPTCTVSDAGSVLKWYRNNFCGAERALAQQQGTDVYRLIDEEAAGIPAGSQGLLLLPYFTGASYAVKDANTFGVFAGIRNFHTHAHFSRAIMEGVALSLRAVLDSFRADGYHVDAARLGGGGARSPLWSQIIADVLNIPIYIPACEEASCLGSAIVAALGLGLYETLDQAVENMVHIRRTYYPSPEDAEAYNNTYTLFHTLFRGLTDFYSLHDRLAYEKRI